VAGRGRVDHQSERAQDKKNGRPKPDRTHALT
jgi:hypothetical protein